MDESVQLATLKVDVDYIKSNVIELKAGLARLDEKLDTISARVSRGEKSVLQLEISLIEKIDVGDRRLTDKIDDLDKHLTAKIDDVDERLTGKIDDLDKRLTAKIDDVDERLTGKIDDLDKRLTAKIDDVDERLTGKIDDLDKRLTAKIDNVDERITAVDKHLVEKFGEMRLWVMGLCVAQAASLLLVIAKGFKWL